MTNQIDHIVEHFFDKKRLDDVSVYELERFIATHPYFAAGHFLLAKKIQTTQPNQTKENLATTSLYYSNALWLQWLLDQDPGSLPKEQARKESNDYEDIVEEKSVDIVATYEPETIAHPEKNGEPDEIGLSSVAESLQENESSQDTGLISDSPSSPDQEETGHAYQHETPAESEADFSVESEKEQQTSFQSPPEEKTSAANETGVAMENVHSGETNYQHEFESPNEPELASKTETRENSLSDEDQEPEVQNESTPEQTKASDEESRASAASIERTLTSAALIPTRAEIEKNEFTFEPYHTIDYFASQGIKLQQSDLSKDKFGKQLKSFTEWLRSMKRLPQAAVETNMDEATQQSIQHIAEHSFEEKEIVTETMAEVWIKQGNKEKAIDTLHKLSLLNPSKSHYFAAKIEQLKAL